MNGRNVLKYAILGGIGYFIYKVLTQPSVSGSVTEKIENLASDVENVFSPGSWATSTNAVKYLPYILQIEQDLSIPPYLLARVAYQESHFRDDIVNGTVRSPAGAVGLFQLLPQYFPGAGVDWRADTGTAGNYLSGLFHQFGDWQSAVAAYNDGPGNLNKILAGTKAMPAETQKYLNDVFADVPVPGRFVDISSYA